jgi:peptide/nickel transport system ATP-binding protein
MYSAIFCAMHSIPNYDKRKLVMENNHTNSLLDISELSVCIPTRFGEFTAVDNVCLKIKAAEIHGLVGESGAGKSTVGAAIIGLLDKPAYIKRGTIKLKGESLSDLHEDALHRLRGQRVSMILQDPQTSLNPLLSIADQLVETIRQHRNISYADARAQAIDLLQETGIEEAASRIDEFPHQFSGGMRQRVVIALALCTNPQLIVADEPTTALDVSVQKQILKLIKDLADQRSVGVLLITHDLGVIAEITDNVTVLRYGQVVESGPTRQVLGAPKEPYTQALMAAVPRLDKRLQRFRNIVRDDRPLDDEQNWKIPDASRDTASRWLLAADDSPLANSSVPQSRDIQVPVLDLQQVKVTFGKRRGWFSTRPGFPALQSIDLQIGRGEVLGLVGESGSGKSTLAKAVVGLLPLSGGHMVFNGQALPDARNRSRQHPARRQIQMIFQDPYSSLNNRRTVEALLTEPLTFYRLARNGTEARKLIASVLELVEMPQRAMLKYPHQFSGGQRQRIAVARALMARPEFLICDEPTSALDVSIQAQILNLLKDLQENLGLTILFISHDLAVVRQMADRIAVLRRGVLIESAESETFFNAPQAPYSRQLLDESPSLTMLTSN